MNDSDIARKIREVLLQEWDPCGVGDNPNLADEYDSYIPALLKLVKTSSSSVELSRALLNFEQALGISLPREQHSRTVEGLSLLVSRPSGPDKI